LTDITTLRVEGTAIPGMMDQAMEKALAGVKV